MNAGIEYATRAAQAINADLATPGQPGDFNDLHAAEGIEAVQRRIDAARPVGKTAELDYTETANPDKWPEPLPLKPDEQNASYPVEALPGAIGEAVAEITRFVQCPFALTACTALAAASTVVAGLVDVRRANKLQGPAGLYFLAVADSGERKTTVDRFFTETIRTWESDQKEVRRPELQAYRAADAAWAAERDGLVMAIKDASKRGKPTIDIKEKLRDHEALKPVRPMVPRLLIGDATSEALTWRLAKRWPVGGLLSSEAGAVFGSHAMGRDSVMRNLATLNSLWDGVPLAVDRRTSESYTVQSARLTLGLAVQPETIRQFVNGTRGLARGIGFLARFLFSCPESTQGSRMYQEAPEYWPALDQFRQRLGDLLDVPLRLDDYGQLKPMALCFDAEAKAVWVNFHDEVESELVPGGDMVEARDVASKAGDNVARLAALFHVFEHGPIGNIGVDHMQRAAKIVAWHLYEARRFLNQFAIPEAVADALLLESWLIERCKTYHSATLPVSLLHKSAPNRLRKKAPLEAALNELENAHRVRLLKQGRRIDIEVNPRIMGDNHGA